MAEAFYVEELDSQVDLTMEVNKELPIYKEFLHKQTDSVDYDSNKDLIALMAQMNTGEGKPPPLECGIFNGIGQCVKRRVCQTRRLTHYPIPSFTRRGVLTFTVSILFEKLRPCVAVVGISFSDYC